NLLDPARTGVPEQGTQGFLAGARGHHAVDADRLLAADQGEEGMADGQQLVAQRALGRAQQQLVRQHFAALGGDGLGEQSLLVAEVAVDRELGHPGSGGDLVHAHALVAELQEHALGRVEDRGALGEVLRTSGAGVAGGRRGAGWHGLAGHAGNTRLFGFLFIPYRPVHYFPRTGWSAKCRDGSGVEYWRPWRPSPSWAAATARTRRPPRARSGWSSRRRRAGLRAWPSPARCVPARKVPCRSASAANWWRGGSMPARAWPKARCWPSWIRATRPCRPRPRRRSWPRPRPSGCAPRATWTA